MPGIGVVINPYSRQHRKNPDQIKRLGFVVGDKASCQTTDDLQDLRRVAESFKTRDIDILAIGGGDGTNHQTLSQFIEVYGEKPLPKVTFLRGGTTNTVAGACRIKGDPEKILSNLIYKYHQDQPFETTELDLMQINGSKYGFIFGTGLIYRFMEAYYTRLGMPPSVFKSVITLGWSVASASFNTKFARELFERYDGEVWVDGKKWDFENWSTIFAGSIPVLGLNCKIFHFSEAYQKFHAMGISIPPRDVLKHVPRMFQGKPSLCKDLIEAPASEMKIELAEPIAYTVDGEMLKPEKSFMVKTGPRLTILVG